MNSYAFATIRQLQTALRDKACSRQELLSFFLERFRRYDNELCSALEIFPTDSILEHAGHTGPLEGIPGGIKDTICQKDRLTTCASRILENFVSPYDATAADRLKKAGALLIGRLNCDEFAMGSSTETSAFLRTKNPWNHERVPGGSSGGSAAAVAAGLIPWSLGSETGGSVRQPAALCGIVGLKPTYGLVSRYGLVAYASSLDQIGVFTRTVEDNARVLSVIAGHDVHDSTSLSVGPKEYERQLEESIKPGIRIGIIENAMQVEGIDPQVHAALDKAIALYERLGAHVERITIPVMDYSAATYFITSRAEAASNLARFDGVRYGVRAEGASDLADMYQRTREEGFGSNVKGRIMIGNYVLSAGHAGRFYENARKVQNKMRQEIANAFKKVDLLFAPCSPGPAFSFDAFNDNTLQLDLQDYFTCIANLTGIPGISVPCGFSSDGLPLGFQLLAPHLHEGLLYQAAHAYEQKTEWYTMHPPHYL